MQYRRLGRTGLDVSVVGFGTNQLRLVPPDQAVETLLTGFENGVNIVHTSADYEGADALVAEAVKRTDKQVFVAANAYDVHGNSDGPVDHFEAHFERTCELLDTRRLDLYGIAAVEDREALAENLWGEKGMVAFLRRMQRQGRLGHTFCTTHGGPDFVTRIVNSDAFDAVMVSYNPLGFHALSLHPPAGRHFENLALNRLKIFRLCRERDVGVMVMMPLAGGLLVESRTAPPLDEIIDNDERFGASDVLRTILADDDVTSVFPGTACPEEALENAQAGHEPQTVSPEASAALRAHIVKTQSTICSRCGACETLCSRDLPVSWLFRAAHMSAQPAEAFETWADVDYFRLHPSGVAPCDDCEEVTCACPYGLDIPKSLTREHTAMVERAARALVPLPPGDTQLNRGNGDFAARILRFDPPSSVEHGQDVICRLFLENIGTMPWPNTGDKAVRLVVKHADGEASEVRARDVIHPEGRGYFVFKLCPPATGSHVDLALNLRLPGEDDAAKTIELLSERMPVPASSEQVTQMIREWFNIKMSTEKQAKEDAPAERSQRPYGVEWIAHNVPQRWMEDEPYCFYLTVRNTGTRPWRAQSADGKFVNLIVKLNSDVLSFQTLSHDVEPDQQVTFQFTHTLPSGLGTWDLSFSFVEQQVAWFDKQGVKPLRLSIEREPAPADRASAARKLMRKANPSFYVPSQGIPKGRDGLPYPLLAASANGARITDTGGAVWIDYVMGWGSTLLGYAHPQITEALTEAVQSGAILSVPHELEARTTELLSDLIPSAEMVLFGKNGSDICTAAVRAARLSTGKRTVLFSGFHGWQSPFAATFEPALAAVEGLPDAHRFTLNDLDGFVGLIKAHAGTIAAVMIEPSAQAEGVDGPVRDCDPAFLRHVADIAREEGAVLIFDEIMTGFRHRRGSVQQATGVIPDLSCFGKALSSGSPLSALVGKRSIMAPTLGQLFYHPTFKSDAYAFAAAVAALGVYRSVDVPKRIAEFGTKLRTELNQMSEEIGIDGEVTGLPYRMVYRFHEGDAERRVMMRTLLQQELLKRGVLTFRGFMLPSLAHGDAELAETLEAYRAALKRVKHVAERNSFTHELEIPPIV